LVTYSAITKGYHHSNPKEPHIECKENGVLLGEIKLRAVQLRGSVNTMEIIPKCLEGCSYGRVDWFHVFVCLW